jgi:hypothetical protein
LQQAVVDLRSRGKDVVMMTKTKKKVNRKVTLVEINVVAVKMLLETVLQCFSKQSIELSDFCLHIAIVIAS